MGVVVAKNKAGTILQQMFQKDFLKSPNIGQVSHLNLS